MQGAIYFWDPLPAAAWLPRWPPGWLPRWLLGSVRLPGWPVGCIVCGPVVGLAGCPVGCLVGGLGCRLVECLVRLPGWLLALLAAWLAAFLAASLIAWLAALSAASLPASFAASVAVSQTPPSPALLEWLGGRRASTVRGAMIEAIVLKDGEDHHLEYELHVVSWATRSRMIHTTALCSSQDDRRVAVVARAPSVLHLFVTWSAAWLATSFATSLAACWLPHRLPSLQPRRLPR